MADARSLVPRIGEAATGAVTPGASAAHSHYANGLHVPRALQFHTHVAPTLPPSMRLAGCPRRMSLISASLIVGKPVFQ